MISSRLGEIIRKRREEIGIGQAKLAELAGTSQGYVSDIENGKAKNPTVETLLNIAKALNMKGETLISEKEGIDNLIVKGDEGILLDINELPEEVRDFVMEQIKHFKTLYIKK